MHGRWSTSTTRTGRRTIQRWGARDSGGFGTPAPAPPLRSFCMGPQYRRRSVFHAASVGLRRGHLDLLPRHGSVERRGQIVAGGLDVLAVRRRLVVDRAVVDDLPLGIDHEEVRRGLGPVGLPHLALGIEQEIGRRRLLFRHPLLRLRSLHVALLPRCRGTDREPDDALLGVPLLKRLHVAAAVMLAHERTLAIHPLQHDELALVGIQANGFPIGVAKLQRRRRRADDRRGVRGERRREKQDAGNCGDSIHDRSPYRFVLECFLRARYSCIQSPSPAIPSNAAYARIGHPGRSVLTGAGAGSPGTTGTSRFTPIRFLKCPASSMTRTPLSRARFPAAFAAGSKVRRYPFPVRSNPCGAACSVTSGLSTKRYPPRGAMPFGGTKSRAMARGPASAEKDHPSGDTGSRARAAARAGASGEGGAGPEDTARESLSSVDPGTQTSAHSSQSSFPWIVMESPSRVRGGVIRTGRITSRSYP